MILINVSTKLPVSFLKFCLVAIFGQKCLRNGQKRSKMGKNGPISAQKMATSQNFKKWLGNFVKTIIRIIHVKFQTFLSILGRVDTFFVIFQKTRFSFNKGNLRDFEGKMSGNGQNFLWPSTYDDIF